jgi:hypothetical protein
MSLDLAASTILGILRGVVNKGKWLSIDEAELVGVIIVLPGGRPYSIAAPEESVREA